MTSLADTYRAKLDARVRGQYVDGAWISRPQAELIEHYFPATGEPVLEFPSATESDVDAAVEAAARAFHQHTARATATERHRWVMSLASIMRKHGTELDELAALDTGQPLSVTRAYRASAAFSADLVEHMAGWTDKAAGSTLPQYTRDVPQQVITVLEPVGVVAAILPFNAAVMQFALKVGAALAAGCTVVVKPSEDGSLGVARLIELVDAEGALPPGVLNLVLGGADVGRRLVSHPLVNKVNFTGSRDVGEAVMRSGASTLKRVTLELGGKNSAIVFPDVDVRRIATRLVEGVAVGLSGQACTTQARALVHASILDEFVGAAAEALSVVRLGDPFDLSVTSSPLINTRSMERVLDLKADGAANQAEIIESPARPTSATMHGYWVPPSLVVSPNSSARILREEVFGPLLSIEAFTDEDEACNQANDTPYGLLGAVYTDSIHRAFRVARRLRVGTVGINGTKFLPNSPFGGMGQSGVGREGAWESIRAHTELKAIAITVEEETT